APQRREDRRRAARARRGAFVRLGRSQDPRHHLDWRRRARAWHGCNRTVRGRGRDALQGQALRSQQGVPLSKAGQRPLLTLAALVLVAFSTTGAAQDRGATSVEYPTGDSCLFCHRNDIGSSWLDNSHAWTIRPAGEPPRTGALPPDATHVIGRDHY